MALDAILAQATYFLGSQDADFEKLIAAVGTCALNVKTNQSPYEALVRAIAYQQLHSKAGDAIMARFTQHFGCFPTPQMLINADVDAIRACGFSAKKADTLKGIAEATLANIVPSREQADALTNEELVARLTPLKGIGQWTVEMMLIFTLGRLDIMPADDFGVVQGYKRLKSLSVAPKRKEMLEISKTWSPYRTIASWYLWRVPK